MELRLFFRLSFDAVAVAAAVGIVPLLFMAELPSPMVWWSMVFVACGAALFRYRLCRWISLTLAFFLWGTLCAGRLCDSIEHYAGQRAVVEGYVVSASLHLDRQAAGKIFYVDSVNGRPLSLTERLSLSLAFPMGTESIREQMQAGQRWRLSVDFRPVHSRLNEGGYDRQRGAMANGQPLIGRIKSAERLDDSPSFRQRLISRALEITAGLEYRDVLMALAFGERELMSKENRQRFMKTGTAHLMAISGLHVVFAGAFGAIGARGVQLLLPCRFIEPRFPLLVGWCTAAVYVWLAGANPPAARTLCAMSVYLALRLGGFHWSSWQIWLRCMAFLLVLDPMMAISDSFWLSCLAVAGLIFWFQCFPLAEKGGRFSFIGGWLSAQIAMMVLLLPLQFLLFHGLSLSSLFGNAVAIPVVSWLAVPLILCGLITLGVPAISSVFWWLADRSISFMMAALGYLEFGWIEVSTYGVVLSFLGWGVAVAWRFGLWHSCPYSLSVTLFLFFLPCWQNQSERWRVDMLDVGHGLAVVIRQRNEAVIYDTGQRWGETSMAEREIIPFLRWHGLKLVGIILSHQHADHSGGLEELRREYPDAWLKSSVNGLGEPCKQNEQWRWGILAFQSLWPVRLTDSAGNAESCVVRVDDGRFGILLTGDLEREQEQLLIAQYGSVLSSTLLQVPHHGSKTSSTAALLLAAQPQAAMASAAKFNPWRLPAKSVVTRYRQAGIKWYSTSEEGQLSALFYHDNYHLFTLRAHIMPRWYHASFGSLHHNE